MPEFAPVTRIRFIGEAVSAPTTAAVVLRAMMARRIAW